MAPLSALRQPKRGRVIPAAAPCPTETAPSNGSGCSDGFGPVKPPPPSPPRQGPSVTLLSLEPLPSSYGGDRSYVLSEIQAAARELLLLDDDVDPAAAGAAATNEAPDDPTFAVLYLQWQPHLPVDVFLSFLRSQTERAHARLAPAAAAPDLVDESAPVPVPSSPALTSDSDDDRNADAARPACHLYVVVDSADDGATAPQEPEAAALDLARRVAADARLRHRIQGVTVGVTNRARVAPGLDACVQALGVGGEDRYRFGSQGSGSPKGADADTTRSLITIVATSADSLHGWHPTLPVQAAGDPSDAPAGAAAAADGGVSAPLTQCRVVAEWGGRGNLASFGQRAHAQWRRRQGLWTQPACLGPARRPVPRLRPPPSLRILRDGGNPSVAPSSADVPTAWKGYNPNVLRRRLRRYAIDALVLACFGFYLWFHHRDDMLRLLRSPPSLVDLAQYLRSL